MCSRWLPSYLDAAVVVVVVCAAVMLVETVKAGVVEVCVL